MENSNCKAYGIQHFREAEINSVQKVRLIKQHNITKKIVLNDGLNIQTIIIINLIAMIDKQIIQVEEKHPIDFFNNKEVINDEAIDIIITMIVKKHDGIDMLINIRDKDFIYMDNKNLQTSIIGGRKYIEEI